MRKVNAQLTNLLLKIAGEKYRELVIIQLEWATICGTIMSERSKIVKYEKGILYVKVIDHLWLQEFVWKRPTFLEKLRTNTGVKVENILFNL